VIKNVFVELGLHIWTNGGWIRIVSDAQFDRVHECAPVMASRPHGHPDSFNRNEEDCAAAGVQVARPAYKIAAAQVRGWARLRRDGAGVSGDT
jgi:hypothetical protein